MLRTVHVMTPQLSEVADSLAQGIAASSAEASYVGGILLRIEADCLSVALITFHVQAVSTKLIINSINRSIARKNLEMRQWLRF